MATFHFLKRQVPPKWKRKLHERVASLSVRHHSGSKAVRLSSNEAAVTCVVKNGEFYVERFIEHYSQMGFRHIFFLDNGSTDGTISIARKHRNVSVYESILDIDKYQAVLKKHLARISVVGGWCLDADIDEFFDYPFSDVLSLSQFLEYLNKHQYTAVLTQMLDMFSEKPLSYLAKKQEEDLKATYRYYDISAVMKTGYRESEIAVKYGKRNELSNDNLAIYSGGIRKTLYGNNCLLSKHSLFFRGESIELFPHVHFMNRARIADVSCVLLHFKLTSNAYETASQNKEAFLGTSKGYSDFIDLLENRPDYRIKQNGAVELRNVNDLVNNGFLVVSDDYRKHVDALRFKA